MIDFFPGVDDIVRIDRSSYEVGFMQKLESHAAFLFVLKISLLVRFRLHQAGLHEPSFGAWARGADFLQVHGENLCP